MSSFFAPIKNRASRIAPDPGLRLSKIPSFALRRGQHVPVRGLFSGPSLELLYTSPLVDLRTPDIIVAPNAGVVYTGGTKKIAEHGGSAQDDRNVMLLLSHPSFAPRTVTLPVETRQVAPTILKALGLNPLSLDAVRKEGTQTLPFSF